MKDKKDYNTFREVERITLTSDTGIETAVLLKVNDIRLFRIEFYLDEQPIKPKLYTGKNKAYTVWDELKQRLLRHTPALEAKIEEPKECNESE